MESLEPLDFALLASLLPLLLCSAFFSASETVFFGLGVEDRAALRARGGLAATAAEVLLQRPQQLLVTVLLGNISINTIFMTISAVLLLRHKGAPLTATIFVVGSLVLLIVFGEILPKIAGQTHRVAAAAWLGPSLAALHRIIAPLRLTLSRVVITPLARLAGAPPKIELGVEELAALLDVSVAEGAIDQSEEHVLREVVKMGDLSVRDIMTPRVHVEAVDIKASDATIRETVARTGLGRLPVVGASLDDVRGIISSRRYLMQKEPSVRGVLQPIAFVPEQASVENLLRRFRDEGSTIAMVVDEYGGTAGIVSIEDVAEEIVGDIVEPQEHQVEIPQRLSEGRWRISGMMPLHDWRQAFGAEFQDRRVATVAGLFFARLERLVRQGDVVRVANVRLVAERVEHGRVVSAIVDLVGSEDKR